MLTVDMVDYCKHIQRDIRLDKFNPIDYDIVTELEQMELSVNTVPEVKLPSLASYKKFHRSKKRSISQIML